MAKLYCAKWHIGRGGFRPGEVFEAEPDDPEIVRLLRMNAISECEILPDIPGIAEALESVEVSGEPVQEEAEASTDVIAEEEEAAPEIDVMDGISAAPAEAPKTSSRKRSGGKAK